MVDIKEIRGATARQSRHYETSRTATAKVIQHKATQASITRTFFKPAAAEAAAAAAAEAAADDAISIDVNVDADDEDVEEEVMADACDG
jgi:hypothetical protein